MITVPQNMAHKIALFQRDYPEYVAPYFLWKLKNAISKNRNRVILYRLENTDIAGIIFAEEYLKLLNILMDIFIDEEMYEQADECKKLITKFSIEQLIEETKKINHD